MLVESCRDLKGNSRTVYLEVTKVPTKSLGNEQSLLGHTTEDS